jgi:hypothetical protein
MEMKQAQIQIRSHNCSPPSSIKIHPVPIFQIYTHLIIYSLLLIPQVRESVLAVMQVASSVAMCCGGSGVPLLDTPHRGPRPHPSPQGGVGEGTEAAGGLPDISDCQVSVRSLKKMFDDGVAAGMEEEPMEICTRL